MKNIWKKITLLAIFAVLISSLFVMANSVQGPGYNLSGSLNNDILTVTIATQGDTTVVGRLGLSFDTEHLTLLDRNSAVANTSTAWAAVVNNVSSIVLHSEANATSDMFSVDKGYILLSWYSNSTSGVKAGTTISTLRFRVKEGVSKEDFSRNTLRLIPARPEGIKGWDSMAYVWVYDGEQYKYNTTNYSQVAVNVSYPNSTEEPSNARAITLKVENSAGEGVPSAKILVDNEEFTADGNGIARFKITDGEYIAMAEATGYIPQSKAITVSGAPVSDEVTLLTDAEGVAADTNALEIGYSVEGDSAKRVTGHILLPDLGEHGTTIVWRSSNTSLVAHSGAVSRPVYTDAATLTATVSRKGISQTREFELTVKGTYNSPEEQLEEKIEVAKGVFKDLEGYDWAKDSIATLYALGIIKGTSEETYGPGASITRADFILLMIRMLGIEDERFSGNFSDVASVDYYFNALGVAKKLGITDGIGDNKFDPAAPITRQDMMTLCSRALIKLGVIEEMSTDGALNGFTDKGAVNSYATDAVAQMVAQGFIKGDGGSLNPTNNTSRAETAVFLFRIYEAVY